MKYKSSQWERDQTRHAEKKIRQKTRETQAQMMRELDEKWERRAPINDRDDYGYKRFC